MLKRVPYSSQLAQIGNSDVWDGKMVWSDGRVAYGWNYPAQKMTHSAKNFSGLNVGYVLGNKYYLARGFNGHFKLVGPFTSNFPSQLGRTFAYPWLAYGAGCDRFSSGSDGVMTDGVNSYNWEGTLVYMDKNGGLLSYKDWNLLQYSINAQGQVSMVATDLSQFVTTDSLGSEFMNFYDRWRLNDTLFSGRYTVHKNEKTDFARRMFQLATAQGAYISIWNSPTSHTDYYCSSGNVIQQNYPQTRDIGDGVTLRLSDLAVIYRDKDDVQHVVTGDVLKLYCDWDVTYGEYSFIAGAHALWHRNDLYIISQSKNLLFYNGTAQVTNYGIPDCYEATWFDKKWRGY